LAPLEASARHPAHSPIVVALQEEAGRTRIFGAAAGHTLGIELAVQAGRRGGNPGGKDQGSAAAEAGGSCSSRPGRPEADTQET
jgi:hypothetical protein